jgi:hypothetical protein
VGEVVAADGAVFLDLELFRHRPLVLRRVVIGAVAVTAGQFDDVSHRVLRSEPFPDLSSRRPVKG